MLVALLRAWYLLVLLSVVSVVSVGAQPTELSTLCYDAAYIVPPTTFDVVYNTTQEDFTPCINSYVVVSIAITMANSHLSHSLTLSYLCITTDCLIV
jgi:hypothetical protein